MKYTHILCIQTYYTKNWVYAHRDWQSEIVKSEETHAELHVTAAHTKNQETYRKLSKIEAKYVLLIFWHIRLVNLIYQQEERTKDCFNVFKRIVMFTTSISNFISASANCEPTFLSPVFSSSYDIFPSPSESINANISLITSTSSSVKCSAMTYAIQQVQKQFKLKHIHIMLQITIQAVKALEKTGLTSQHIIHHLQVIHQLSLSL